MAAYITPKAQSHSSHCGKREDGKGSASEEYITKEWGGGYLSLSVIPLGNAVSQYAPAPERSSEFLSNGALSTKDDLVILPTGNKGSVLVLSTMQKRTRKICRVLV